MVVSITSALVSQHENPIPNAAVHNGILVTSGILGKELESGKYPPEFAIQSRLCFLYLQRILEAVNASIQDVVKLDVYLGDKSCRSIVNQIWLEFWPDEKHRPARQTHQSILPEGCMVQLVAMAVITPQGHIKNDSRR
jgi:2-iminobutanoate/2-iminopropanoate deaminase